MKFTVQKYTRNLQSDVDAGVVVYASADRLEDQAVKALLTV